MSDVAQHIIDEREASGTVAKTKPAPSESQFRHLTLGLFVVVSVVLGVLTLVLCGSLYFEYTNYSLGIQHALQQPNEGALAVITYARAWDFAVVKTVSMFLSFTLIFVGSLYVLKTTDVSYGLSVQSSEVKGSFNTSSPGLVMITLGVVLAALVIYSKSNVSYTPTPAPIPANTRVLTPQPGTPSGK